MSDRQMEHRGYEIYRKENMLSWIDFCIQAAFGA